MSAYNVQSEMKGGKLVITVDLSNKALEIAPLSSSGKSYLVASSAGFMPTGVDGVAFSLNVSKSKRNGNGR